MGNWKQLFLLVIFGAGCVRGWNPECLHEKLIEGWVNCHPDEGASEERCLARGCCWSSQLPPDGAPVCFYPENYGYYVTQKPTTLPSRTTLQLERYDTPTLFGGDVHKVAVIMEELSDYCLRIKIFDPANMRAEVPINIKPSNWGSSTSRKYQYQFSEKPFSFRVTRRSTGTTILDTQKGPLVFADQFLQLTLGLSSPHVYGLGEHLHQSLKHDMDWKNWPIHAAGKHPSGYSKNMYGSFPVFLNIEEDGNANMVLLLNQHAMDVVLQPSPAVTFRMIGGVLDFYVFLGEWDKMLSGTPFCDDRPDGCERGEHVKGGKYKENPEVNTAPPVQAIQHYIEAVGLPVMPPYWALGFQLCRWNYTDSATLKKIIQRNRVAGIPFDVQWVDIDYMADKQSFTIDPENFTDLPDIAVDLHNHGQKLIAIQDPCIRVTPPGEYLPYDEGCWEDIWIKHSDGRPLIGKVWPGECKFPDFTKQKTVDWWIRHSRSFHDTLSYDGFWIDMNEPKSLVHGSTEGCKENRWNYPPYTPNITNQLLWHQSICMDSVQEAGRHYDVHGLYGHDMAKATYKAAEAVFGEKRSLIVTRSSFVGTGHYAFKWLGDNKSTYDQMKWSIPGIIEFNMFGIPYTGADICGFMLESNEKLCQRWMQLGAFYPMSRNHNIRLSKHQDPAAYSQEMIRSSRDVLLTRYRLLPYLYTLFHLAHTTGQPVARALAWEFPLDETAMSIDTQFLWGDALMISAVLTEDTVDLDVYFPAGRWYNFYTGKEIEQTEEYHNLHTPMDSINLHVRGGAALPMQDPGNTTEYSRRNPMSVLIALDKNFEASGSVFWDDGELRDSYKKKKCRIVHYRAGEVC